MDHIDAGLRAIVGDAMPIGVSEEVARLMAEPRIAVLESGLIVERQGVKSVENADGTFTNTYSFKTLVSGEPDVEFEDGFKVPGIRPGMPIVIGPDGKAYRQGSEALALTTRDTSFSAPLDLKAAGVVNGCRWFGLDPACEGGDFTTYDFREFANLFNDDPVSGDVLVEQLRHIDGQMIFAKIKEEFAEPEADEPVTIRGE